MGAVRQGESLAGWLDMILEGEREPFCRKKGRVSGERG